MRWLPGIVALLLPLLGAGTAQASTAFTVQSAVVTVRNGAYEVDARVIFPLDEDVRSALANGVTVRFALQAVVDRQRRYWFDTKLADATLRRELSWNAVSQRYLLRYTDSGEQDSFRELDEALAATGVMNGWRILDEDRLNPRTTYEVSIRAGYRTSRLPYVMRALAFWSDGWVHRTDWKSWILPR